MLDGLAIDRSTIAAVMGRNMDPVRASQHPMDMGGKREGRNIVMTSVSCAKHHEHGIDLAASFDEGALAFKHPTREVLP